MGVGWSLVFPGTVLNHRFWDSRIWHSQRILFGVVQVGTLAISMVTVYLWPNAPLTSRRYLENCEIISAAVRLARSVSGPVILAGDFNTSLAAFEDMQTLLLEGWADAAWSTLNGVVQHLHLHASGPLVIPSV